jgi:hypothetical protein
MIFMRKFLPVIYSCSVLLFSNLLSNHPQKNHAQQQTVTINTLDLEELEIYRKELGKVHSNPAASRVPVILIQDLDKKILEYITELLKSEGLTIALIPDKMRPEFAKIKNSLRQQIMTIIDTETGTSASDVEAAVLNVFGPLVLRVKYANASYWVDAIINGLDLSTSSTRSSKISLPKTKIKTMNQIPNFMRK